MSDRGGGGVCMRISTCIIVNNTEASDVLLTSLVSKSGIFLDVCIL